LGGIVFFINIILTFLLTYMKNIGLKRGAAISGWVSLLTGSLILVTQTNLSITTNVTLIMAIVSVFAIIFIFLPALSPQANLRFLRYPIKISMRIGYFIGYLTAAILTFFKFS